MRSRPEELPSLVAEAFSALISNGYHIDADGVYVAPTYVTIPLVGNHWVITVVFDFRDGVVDCNVRRIYDDNSKDVGLLTYLVDHHHYRGNLYGLYPPESDGRSEEFRALRCYALAIEKHAPPVFNDSEPAL